jgi:molecular chaperone GrpE (heat shock protein)|nr:MAG TPA: hypothetical protein [Caudoviricetes sp.]
MSKEKDFFKTCFNIVAGLEVKNESQAIAKEVVLSEIKNLEQKNKQLKDNWNKLKEDLIKIRQLTFTKYNKNEWGNCLSFNDDILPLIEKMQEIEQGSESNE